MVIIVFLVLFSFPVELYLFNVYNFSELTILCELAVSFFKNLSFKFLFRIMNESHRAVEKVRSKYCPEGKKKKKKKDAHLII